MKKREISKLKLNKKSISKLFLPELKGGLVLLFSNQPTCECTDASHCECVSDEYNCNSDSPDCDCGTSGNC